MFISCGSGNIDLVKYGTMDLCEFTVGEMVDSYFSNPKWEEIVSDDNRSYVNITGVLRLSDEPVVATLQFKIRDDRFMVNALEVDGEGQNELIILDLLNSMCEEAF
jgi:hypothetical protein